MLKQRSPARTQRGLSIVELMVGVAIGLFVVAAATLLVSSQLASNRRLLLDTQIQQDLRATVDIITRELRRSGSLNNQVANTKVWSAGATAVDGNATADAMSVPGACGAEVLYRYYRVTQDDHGFDVQGDAIRTKVPGSGYQQLTDSSVLKVTNFCVEPLAVTRTRVPCPKACPVAGGGENDSCWPEVVVRDYRVTVSGVAANDSSIQRTLSSTVRVRNDFVVDNSGGVNAYTDNHLCPP